MAKRNEISVGTRVIKTNDFMGEYPELVGIEGTVKLDRFGGGPGENGCAVLFDNGAQEWLFYDNIEVLGGNK